MPLATTIRIFNRSGIEAFREQLHQIEEGRADSISADLILSDRYSNVAPRASSIEQRRFELKIDAARYLTPYIEQIQIPNKYYSAGLWAWLSAFYFDSLCPPLPDGTRKTGAIYLYIPGDINQHGNPHRHLLATPVRIFRSHGDAPKMILYEFINRNNEFVNELAFRQDLAMNRGVLEAANRLYWDEEKQKAKSGAVHSQRQGTLRRFISVISQLDLTYDLQSMSGDQIIRLLPQHEFGMWLD